MAAKLGDTVRQIMPAPFQGEVVGFKLDDEGNRSVLVRQVVGDEVQEVYFGDDQIEPVSGA